MFGGEYLKYKSKQKEVIFSPSQYYLDKLSEYNFQTVEESNKHIRNSVEQIRKDVLNMHADVEYFRIDAGKGKLFSDANIDLENVNAIFNPENGFGVCELESEITYKRKWS